MNRAKRRRLTAKLRRHLDPLAATAAAAARAAGVTMPLRVNFSPLDRGGCGMVRSPPAARPSRS